MSAAYKRACLVPLVALVAMACTGPGDDQGSVRPPGLASSSDSASPGAASTGTPASPAPRQPAGPVTLGFAGDVHFEGGLAVLLRRPQTALGPVTRALRRPDLMMVNLETAITTRGTPYPKTYNFRTSPRALEALAAAGVDVVTMANNHAADYGAVGLRDTLAAARAGPLPVVGVGRDAAAAFQPHVTSVRGTRVAVLAATTVADETAAAWAANRDQAGVAVALMPRPRLLGSVRAASRSADLVVVYLHWGSEYQPCPDTRQRAFARALVAAGADAVVGSHAHVLQGAGWLRGAYVAYGLGNFLWYNRNAVDTGILTLTVRGGRVVSGGFQPADIGADGRARLVSGPARRDAVTDWRGLRACTNLAARPAR